MTSKFAKFMTVSGGKATGSWRNGIVILLENSVVQIDITCSMVRVGGLFGREGTDGSDMGCKETGADD